MATVVEYFNDDRLELALVTAQEPKRLTVRDVRGREQRVAPDKVLFRHQGSSIDSLTEQLEQLSGEVDISLIWESLHDEGRTEPQQARALATLFFDRDDSLHESALFRALLADRLYFRRRGTHFTPRSPDELDQIRQMHAAESRAAAELATLRSALDQRPVDAELAQRIERWLRGQPDRSLQDVLQQLSKDPARHAFDLLLAGGRIPKTVELGELRANLCAEHPPSVLAYAAALQVAPAASETGLAAFAIDDPETREVDDALSIHRDGDLLRVDVDIADVAFLIEPGDPVDREARRRATTVYLPARTYYMLPETIGCDRASLLADQPRPALRLSAWLDEGGEIRRSQLSRHQVRVQRTLSYEEADTAIANSDDGDSAALCLFRDLATRRQQRRLDANGISIHPAEWKVRVSDDGSDIQVTTVPRHSPARMLVAEMMILANELSATTAKEAQLPILYRTQAPPAGELPPHDPDDPVAFVKLRGLLTPAALSLEPRPHCGLGLAVYTQATSPLRRYTDLVQQRQLCALIAGERPPYDTPALLEIIAAIEESEQQAKRLEAAARQRWSVEYLGRQPREALLEGWVIAEIAGGYKVRLVDTGADGILSARSGSYTLGKAISVQIDRIQPRRGFLRLKAARPPARL